VLNPAHVRGAGGSFHEGLIEKCPVLTNRNFLFRRVAAPVLPAQTPHKTALGYLLFNS
jgi:hypothetical protein